MPYVIEPAAGLTRSLMAFLIDAYAEDEAPNTKGGFDKRTVLRLDRRLAPVKAAVLPLSRNADLSPKARDLAAELRKHWNVDFDDAGQIGRRYRRQDEIGTPFCITVDFDTLDDQAVTIRERDSMTQQRIALDQVAGLPGRRAARRLTPLGRQRRRQTSRRGLSSSPSLLSFLPMLGNRFFTAALTFFCSALVPCCATRASALRACALSGIGYLRLARQGERLLAQLLPVLRACSGPCSWRPEFSPHHEVGNPSDPGSGMQVARPEELVGRHARLAEPRVHERRLVLAGDLVDHVLEVG